MARGNILVTGASSGIGRASAIRLAQSGFRVFAGVREARACEALRTLSPAIEPVLLDVRIPDSIKSAVEATGGEPLAGLVNNAGISAPGPVEMVPLEAWRLQFEVNVIGLIAVTQAFLPQLRRAKGRIVNIGSVAGLCALPGTGAYDGSKFALEGITDSLRMELRPAGIRVSLIQPGAIATAIWEKALKDLDERIDNASPELRSVYGHLLTHLRTEAARAVHNALPADTVAKAVGHAITARRPKTRYAIGADARLGRLLRLLPDRWRDWLILRELNR